MSFSCHFQILLAISEVQPTLPYVLDLKDFFSICDVENTILTYPPYSILSIYQIKFPLPLTLVIFVQCFIHFRDRKYPITDLLDNPSLLLPSYVKLVYFGPTPMQLLKDKNNSWFEYFCEFNILSPGSNPASVSLIGGTGSMHNVHSPPIHIADKSF